LNLYLLTVLIEVCSLYRALHFLIGQSAPVRRSSKFLLQFLKVTIRAIVCLSPVIDCESFLRRRVRLDAGGVSGGALDRRLSVKRGRGGILYVDKGSNTFLNACTYSLNDKHQPMHFTFNNVLV